MEKGKKHQAYDIIKQKILSGELAPSSDISEEQLIKELGISRTPIREAIQKLSEEGFIIIYPRKGSIVSEITLDMIQWVYEIRKVNEPYITRAVCGRISIEWLLRIKEDFQKIIRMIDANDPGFVRSYVELDKELHETILESFDNVMLKGFMRTIYDHSHRMRIRTGHANMQCRQAVMEHIDIINALLDKDADRAEEMARVHLVESVRTAYTYNH